MPGGDHTPVGSRGISLSGGQKQRLALARAVYARKDVVALDDVLSALDARTGKLVFERLLSKDGLLRRLGATIILVTHAVHRLASADQIAVLGQSGQVVQVGTYDELGSCDGYVREILADMPSHDAYKATEDSEIELPMEVVSAQPQAPPVAKVEAILSTSSASMEGKRFKGKQVTESAVLIYYSHSIGWYRALIFLLFTVACLLHQVSSGLGRMVG